MSTLTEPVNETKRCSRCLRELPLTEFRARAAGSPRRHADCRECHALYQRDRRAEESGRKLNRLAANVHRYRKSSIGRIVALVTAAINGFGGTARFVEAQHAYYDWARENGRNDIAFRQLMMIWEMLMAVGSEQRRIDEEVMDSATTEELGDEMEREFFAMLVRFGETDEEARRMIGRILGRLEDGEDEEDEPDDCEPEIYSDSASDG